ncbi:hypothetical protein [Nocardiopsis quinghaiensis]|uniref:hypothetical protein n=1 Tax=Nocardiopsis quinghaiensis TaxID=464995 RepID=UPI0012387986|nr:hypothetical protein [Nocardiopsis quinghaiensis]
MPNGTPPPSDPPDRDDEQATLDRLNRDYPLWSVWRSVEGRYWLATARDRRTRFEPTLMEESAEALETRMRAPGDRAGIPFQREAL